MNEIWDATFADKQLIWGDAPTRSAVLTAERFAARGCRDVLIPGVGYGRNAKPFIDRGMVVTGIEISETAIALARSELGLDLVIHHGSVEQMPFDSQTYDGIFCYGLIYLLDSAARQKLICDCHRQLAKGGEMVFTLIAKSAPMYGRGRRLGDDWYETQPGMRLYFYDDATIEREFERWGLVERTAVDEPAARGAALPFISVTCRADP